MNISENIGQKPPSIFWTNLVLKSVFGDKFWPIFRKIGPWYIPESTWTLKNIIFKKKNRTKIISAKKNILFLKRTTYVVIARIRVNRHLPITANDLHIHETKLYFWLTSKVLSNILRRAVSGRICQDSHKKSVWKKI